VALYSSAWEKSSEAEEDLTKAKALAQQELEEKTKQ
jgi:hypothetical protein